ncbi:hypothetical protein [Mariniflexile sp. HMF6888]|uniref:hypothetical protein n=1 Tax=Mariniflexile sp. HMF6888 TaxID=3373086 RepID=UPI00378991B1
MKILILLIFMVIVSCESKTTFTKLPKHTETGMYDRDDERKGKKYVYQSVLVNNPTSYKKSLEKQLFSYHLKSRDSIFSDSEVITFSTLFYIENHKTSYFINHADDSGGFSSEVLLNYYKQYGIAEIETKQIDNSSELKTEIIFANSH